MEKIKISTLMYWNRNRRDAWVATTEASDAMTRICEGFVWLLLFAVSFGGILLVLTRNSVDGTLAFVISALIATIVSIPIFGSLLQRVIYHYWYHLGENMAIRQRLGQRHLLQFVGDIDRQAPYRPEPRRIARVK